MVSLHPGPSSTCQGGKSLSRLDLASLRKENWRGIAISYASMSGKYYEGKNRFLFGREIPLVGPHLMISVPEIFIFSMYFLNPLGLAMEGEFPVLGAAEHEQLPRCSQDAAMELHSSSWFRVLPNAGDPQSPLWYSACPDTSPRMRCGAPQSSHGRHVANSCAGECAPVQPSRMASEEPACTSARACACVCVQLILCQTPSAPRSGKRLRRITPNKATLFNLLLPAEHCSPRVRATRIVRALELPAPGES